MVMIERKPGLGVRIGPYVLQVLAVYAGEVVFALLDPDKDCCCCGERPADRRCCAHCQAEVVLCPDCVRSWQCPECGTAGE